MTSLALMLVLCAAVLHATWNYFSKRIRGGGAVYVWLIAAVTSVAYLPLAIGVLLIQRPQLGWIDLGFIAGSSLIHIGYFVMLQRGYQAGDLSLVYPLARGTGPLLSTIAAIALFRERPSLLALGGALLIGVGVALLTMGGSIRRSAAGAAVLYGLGTGLLIACYTLWDKYAVSTLAIPPLLFDYGSNVWRTLLLTPIVLRRRREAARLWQSYRGPLLAVGLLSPLSYILVLTALVFTPVSYVAPAREISILLGALLGARLLAEGDTRRRLTAAGAMVAGVIALALG